MRTSILLQQLSRVSRKKKTEEHQNAAWAQPHCGEECMDKMPALAPHGHTINQGKPQPGLTNWVYCSILRFQAKLFSPLFQHKSGQDAGIWLDGGAGVIDPWLLANVFSTPHVSSLFWVATFWPISGITWHRFGSTTLGLDSLWYPCNSAKKHHSCFDCLHSCTSRFMWNLFGSAVSPFLFLDSSGQIAMMHATETTRSPTIKYGEVDFHRYTLAQQVQNDWSPSGRLEPYKLSENHSKMMITSNIDIIQKNPHFKLTCWRTPLNQRRLAPPWLWGTAFWLPAGQQKLGTPKIEFNRWI